MKKSGWCSRVTVFHNNAFATFSLCSNTLGLRKILGWLKQSATQFIEKLNYWSLDNTSRLSPKSSRLTVILNRRSQNRCNEEEFSFISPVIEADEVFRAIVNCVIVQKAGLFYLYTKKRLRVLLTQALPRKSLYQLTRLMQHLKSATPPYKGALRG